MLYEWAEQAPVISVPAAVESVLHVPEASGSASYYPVELRR